jgi:hypothetical protein
MKGAFPDKLEPAKNSTVPTVIVIALLDYPPEILNTEVAVILWRLRS